MVLVVGRISDERFALCVSTTRALEIWNATILRKTRVMGGAAHENTRVFQLYQDRFGHSSTLWRRRCPPSLVFFDGKMETAKNDELFQNPDCEPLTTQDFSMATPPITRVLRGIVALPICT